MKTLSAFVITLMLLLAQPLLADDCGIGPPCQGYADDVPGVTCCPVAVPFDGGLILLLTAGGIGMCVRMVSKKKAN